ncbi:MAG: hypothetical protein ACT4QC_01420 [Planctomycetaceae bacterium]
MLSPATYSVVGVRADGTRVEISRSDTRDAAEHALSLIASGASWREFHILLNGEWPPKPIPSGKLKQTAR